MSREIKLSQDKVTIVDNEDYEWLSEHRWHYGYSRLSHGGYAGRKVHKPGGGQQMIYMHRAILEHSGVDMENLLSDHINLDKLDNRKVNLRAATQSQNQHNRGLYSSNTSGMMGVYWRGTNKKKWAAQIKIDGVNKCLGRYRTREEAGEAYDKAARKFHGEFATTNFEEEEEAT